MDRTRNVNTTRATSRVSIHVDSAPALSTLARLKASADTWSSTTGVKYGTVPVVTYPTVKNSYGWSMTSGSSTKRTITKTTEQVIEEALGLNLSDAQKLLAKIKKKIINGAEKGGTLTLEQIEKAIEARNKKDKAQKIIKKIRDKILEEEE